MKRILCVTIMLGVVGFPLVSLAHEAPHHPKPDAAQQLKAYLLERDTSGGPTRAERLALGAGAAAFATVGVVVGAAFGVVAVIHPDCLDERTPCLQKPPSPDFTPQAQADGRLRGERRMLLADISFITAGALALMAVAAVATAVWPYTWWPMAGG